MANVESSFGDELKSITDDLSADVSEILRIAKAESEPKRKAKAINSSSVSTEPSRQMETIREPHLARIAMGEHNSVAPIIRANVTTRLTRRTNELLTEASLLQKLGKRKPDCRQDIIEVAIIEWLERRQAEANLSVENAAAWIEAK